MKIDISKVNVKDYYTKHLAVMLTDEQHKAIMDIARVRGLTASRFVRNIVIQVIESEERGQ